ncbi:phosphonate ABC transporter, permease protein PhnE [Hyphomonas atlantica corrig.]|uniref:phosphonate ABC transporter, permease protein PhnE n=1 Tax=Hyphomonas atlantica TaxID=1280948 RepID=UPI0023549259|nr:phosphonate ABC transporter, permease protein PhnE [Hyphomonas atlantica]
MPDAMTATRAPMPSGRSDTDQAVVSSFEDERLAMLKRRRAGYAIGFLGIGALFLWSFTVSEIIGTPHSTDPLSRLGEFLNRMNPNLRAETLLEDASTKGSFLNWFYGWRVWLAALWETLQIAIIASALGSFLAVPIAMMMSRNLMPISSVRFVLRRILEAIRTLPDLIVALILVAAFGVGPLAGIITITLSTTARLGKLYSEVNENADLRQLEGVKSTGAGWWSQIRYGIFPQVAPNYASYAMLKFEGNIGAAAALGIIGAGGIGIELSRAITYTLFADYLAILLLMTCMIFIIDMLSEWIRHRLIGASAGGAI